MTNRLPTTARQWRHDLGELGAQVAAVQLQSTYQKENLDDILRLAKNAQRMGAPTLSLDVVHLLRVITIEEESLDFQGLEINNAHCSVFDLSTGPLPNRLRFSDSYFYLVTCTGEPVNQFFISSSYIQTLEGVARQDLMPSYISQNCEVERFDQFATNSELLKTEKLAMPCRVLLTILRKLFAFCSRWCTPGARFLSRIRPQGEIIRRRIAEAY